jgi:hypothetical protein
MAICSLEIWRIRAIFFTQILCMCQNHIFQVKKVQKISPKKLLAVIALSNPTNQLSSPVWLLQKKFKINNYYYFKFGPF